MLLQMVADCNLSILLLLNHKITYASRIGISANWSLNATSDTPLKCTLYCFVHGYVVIHRWIIQQSKICLCSWKQAVDQTFQQPMLHFFTIIVSLLIFFYFYGTYYILYLLWSCIELEIVLLSKPKRSLSIIGVFILFVHMYQLFNKSTL